MFFLQVVSTRIVLYKVFTLKWKYVYDLLTEDRSPIFFHFKEQKSVE